MADSIMGETSVMKDLGDIMDLPLTLLFMKLQA
jgi:hypothetical protein